MAQVQNKTRISIHQKLTFTSFLFVGLALAIFGIFGAKQASAASLYVSPASGSFAVGTTFNVTVRTDTQGRAVNTAEANISYSTDTLELVRVTASPVFNLQTPGSPARGNGTAYFSGGLPTPGYTGSNGIVGTMTFRALREGTASVSITAGKTLLNDGQGTNALSGVAGARYTITAPPVGSPEVTSSSHPDPERWYNKKDLDLSWTRPAGAYGFSFELDQNGDTVPDNTLDTTVTTSKSYPGLADGIWYFHIKARQQPAGAPFGATTHFQVLIDTVPPKPFEVVLVGEANLNDVSRTPMIGFKAEDELSGIDHYDVHLDDEFIETVTDGSYSFKGLSGGPHVVKVMAFDRAGNSQTSSLSFIVTVPARLLEGCTLFLSLLILANLVLLLVVLFLLWLLYRRKKQEPHLMDKRIKEFKLDFDQSLEQLRRRIDYRLTKLMKKPPSDRDRTPASIVKDFDARIDKAKRKFDDKLKEF